MRSSIFVTAAWLMHIWTVLRSGVLQPLMQSEYSPRRALYMAHPWLLWTNVLSDVLTALSYALFFAGLSWLVRKLKHIPELKSHLWVFAALRIFFLASGAAVLVRIVNIWLPLYQFSIAFKIICAAASIPAAILFAWQSPALVSSVARFFQLLVVEQDQAEALRRSEEFLDRTNQIAGVGGWEVDLLTSQVSWSAETYRIHGAPLNYRPTLQDELDFYTPDCRPVITAALEQAFATGKAFDLELSIIRLDGRQIWVRTVGAAELQDGKPIRLAGAFQDISARVAERAALKEANERVAIATDSGEIGIWDWDILKGVVTCDKWMHRLHGMEFSEGPADELRWREQLHPEDSEAVVQAMKDAIHGIRPYDTEFRVIWPDGSVHNIRATAQVGRDENNRALHMVGANWDVTEARRLTAELARQHELLRVTLESIGDGVITTDSNCNIVWLNPVAERMTGWVSSEAIGLPLATVFSIVQTESRVLVQNPVESCLLHRTTARLAPGTMLLRRDGAEFGIEDSAAPILGNRGELFGAVLVFHDVTEQRRLIAESVRVTKLELKMKDEFLSHVSHELRSPLTSIYSFSSIIADGLAGQTTSQQQEYLDIVLKNVTQLQAMIEDLLTVTQAREGKLSIYPREISVVEATIDAVHTLQSKASAKQITVTTHYEANLGMAYADPTRLRQILIILLDNAVKFTPNGGSVNICARGMNSNLLVVEVADTGPGIAEEKRVRVFENLYQITGQSQPGTHNRNGLGLGLYIAKDLVTRQGGEIWITGAAPQGSNFSFTLPLFKEAAMEQNSELSLQGTG